MDKRTLIAKIAKTTEYAQWEVTKIIEPLFDEILQALENGEEVNISNFGKFNLKYHKPKTALHPKKRLKVQIPPKASVSFKATRMFKPTEETMRTLAKVREQE